MTLQILSYQKLLLSLLVSSFLLGDADTTDIDLDALWESTVWEEIEEINEIEGEVEQVTSVAGVRGAEAEDEALEHLYYRKSMKKLSQVELQKALGRLLKKKSTVTDSLTLSKIDKYIKQLKKKIKI
jgi:tyrosyl-tRNA synthetase